MEIWKQEQEGGQPAAAWQMLAVEEAVESLVRLIFN